MARQIFNIRLSYQERAILKYNAEKIGVSSNNFVRNFIHSLEVPPDLDLRVAAMMGTTAAVDTHEAIAANGGDRNVSGIKQSLAVTDGMVAIGGVLVQLD